MNTLIQNKIYKRKCSQKFLSDVWAHIQDGKGNPNCMDMRHILYACNKITQLQVFGPSSSDNGFKWRKEIDDNIGKGNFGKCYLIKIEETDKSLAMKELPVENFKTEEVKVWVLYQKWAFTQKRVDSHPCPYLYAVTYERGKVRMFMDHIQGCTIQQLCEAGLQRERKGPSFLENREISLLWLLHLTCRALAPLHAAGIVHCDMSPNNIMLTHDMRRVVIIDFGLSSILGPGEEFVDGANYPGSIYFMSPQAARNDNLGAKTDVWGAAMTLCILLCGGTPLMERIFPDCGREQMRKKIAQLRDGNSYGRLLWERIRELGLEEVAMELMRRVLRCAHAERYKAEEAAQETKRLLRLRHGARLEDDGELRPIMRTIVERPRMGRPLLPQGAAGDGIVECVPPADVPQAAPVSVGPGGDNGSTDAVLPDTPTTDTVLPSVLPDTPATGTVLPSVLPDTPASDTVLPSVLPDTPATDAVLPSVLPDTPASDAVLPSVLPDTPATDAVLPSVLPDTPATDAVLPSVLPDTPATDAVLPSVLPDTPATDAVLPSVLPDTEEEEEGAEGAGEEREEGATGWQDTDAASSKNPPPDDRDEGLGED